MFGKSRKIRSREGRNKRFVTPWLQRITHDPIKTTPADLADSANAVVPIGIATGVAGGSNLANRREAGSILAPCADGRPVY